MKPEKQPIKAIYRQWRHPENGVLKSLVRPQYFVLKQAKIFFVKTPLLLGVDTIYNKHNNIN